VRELAHELGTESERKAATLATRAPALLDVHERGRESERLLMKTQGCPKVSVNIGIYRYVSVYTGASVLQRWRQGRLPF